MNRRQILKAVLLTPFLGLFKSRKSGASTGLTKTDICNEALSRISETSDTSGGDYTCWGFLDEEPETYNRGTYYWFQDNGPTRIKGPWDTYKTVCLHFEPPKKQIFIGEIVRGVKASDYLIGDRLMLKDGRGYICRPWIEGDHLLLCGKV